MTDKCEWCPKCTTKCGEERGNGEVNFIAKCHGGCGTICCDGCMREEGDWDMDFLMCWSCRSKIYQAWNGGNEVETTYIASE
jgi:hypothetical protein